MAQIEMTTKVKGTCIICNCMPVDETKEDRPPLPMFHAIGVDVNWGEDCNICKVCAGIMADLMGRIDEVKARKLVKKLKQVEEAHHQLEDEHAKLKNRVQRLIDGKKAAKEIKENAS